LHIFQLNLDFDKKKVKMYLEYTSASELISTILIGKKSITSHERWTECYRTGGATILYEQYYYSTV
jgi:hypothetical protein